MYYPRSKFKEVLIKSGAHIAPPDFFQIVRKRRRNTYVFQGVFVQDDEKDASKMCAKSSDGI